MGSDSGGRDYGLTEIFAIKFVLADILIIAALLFAGPLWALAFTILMILSVVLVWYLTTRTEPGDRDDSGANERTVADQRAVDPVTALQERYAAGELSEAEFEAKLDRLLESNERAEAAGVETEALSLERTE